MKKLFTSLFNIIISKKINFFSENARNYIEIVLCSNEKKLREACLGQHVSNFKIINNNLVAVMKKPNVIHMKKPLAVGFAILELSKLFMYQSYDKFNQYFGPKNLDLCFSDTDSFLFNVKCSSLTKKLKSMEHMFDFSKYDKKHQLYDDSKCNSLFYFKDEMKGRSSIREFVGLRPKCYSMQVEDLKLKQISSKKVCKGLKRSSIKNHLAFEEYKNCLVNSTCYYKSFAHLKSKNHQISTSYQKKIALSSMDTKRHILHCGICTTALGSSLSKKCQKLHPI